MRGAIQKVAAEEGDLSRRGGALAASEPHWIGRQRPLKSRSSTSYDTARQDGHLAWWLASRVILSYSVCRVVASVSLL